jgi:hypothetical protein
MKEMIQKQQQAHNLQEGRIYINANTGEPMRLINILPCEGVWMETFDGQGYGETLNFEDVLYASPDEVQDFLEDLEVFKGGFPSYEDDGHQLPQPPLFIHVPALINERN